MTRSRHIPNAVREALMQRSGSKCEYCDSLCKVLEIHHVIEFADGGEHTLDNLVVLCPDCHKPETALYSKNRRIRNKMAVRKSGYRTSTDNPERKRRKIQRRKHTTWPSRKIASRPLRRRQG